MPASSLPYGIPVSGSWVRGRRVSTWMCALPRHFGSLMRGFAWFGAMPRLNLLHKHWLECPVQGTSCSACRAAIRLPRWQRRFLIDSSNPRLGSWLDIGTPLAKLVCVGCTVCKPEGQFGRFEISGKSIQARTFVLHEESLAHRKNLARLLNRDVVPSPRYAPSAEQFEKVLDAKFRVPALAVPSQITGPRQSTTSL